MNRQRLQGPSLSILSVCSEHVCKWTYCNIV
jgi:hypothetical protein